LRPDHPDTLNNRGAARIQIGDSQGAIADYDRSLELQPENAATLAIRGAAKFYMGDDLGALYDFDSSLDLRPDHADTLTMRGATKVYLCDYAGARLDYEEALRVNPSLASTMYNMACLYAKQGHAETAVAWLQQAIEIDDSYRKRAQNDLDFASIDDDSQFIALVKG
jgi:tetratricopeptide (TPR) repeat protein